MPFPNLPNPFPTIKTTTHTCHLIIYYFVSFSVNLLLLISGIEDLWANVSSKLIFVLIFIFYVRSSLSMLFWITPHSNTWITRTYNSLTSSHTIQILSYIPLMSWLCGHNLICTLNCLLNGRLPVLLFRLDGRLRYVNFFLENILLNWFMIIILLSILGILCSLRSSGSSIIVTSRLSTFWYEKLITFGLTAILTLLYLNWLSIIIEVRLAR